MICRVERLVDFKINYKFEHSPPFLSQIVSLRSSTLSSFQNTNRREVGEDAKTWQIPKDKSQPRIPLTCPRLINQNCEISSSIAVKIALRLRVLEKKGVEEVVSARIQNLFYNLLGVLHGKSFSQLLLSFFSTFSQVFSGFLKSIRSIVSEFVVNLKIQQ